MTMTTTTPSARALNLPNHRPFRVQLHGVSVMAFLLAVLEACALMVLQQPVLPAKVAVAEGAVADDALGGV